MTTRTGGYPLMNLAQDHGIDYGDVLVWADYLRASRVGEVVSEPRFICLYHALGRILERCPGEEYDEILHELVTHANERWGPGEPGFIPYFHVVR